MSICADSAWPRRWCCSMANARWFRRCRPTMAPVSSTWRRCCRCWRWSAWKSSRTAHRPSTVPMPWRAWSISSPATIWTAWLCAPRFVRGRATARRTTSTWMPRSVVASVPTAHSCSRQATSTAPAWCSAKWIGSRRRLAGSAIRGASACRRPAPRSQIQAALPTADCCRNWPAAARFADSILVRRSPPCRPRTGAKALRVWTGTGRCGHGCGQSWVSPAMT